MTYDDLPLMGIDESQAELVPRAADSDAPIATPVNSSSVTGKLIDIRPYLDARRKHAQRRMLTMVALLVAALIVGYLIATMERE